MDLSKLSDEDLHALVTGDLSKVSDEGLHHISGGQQELPQLPKELQNGGLIRTPEGRAMHALSPEGLQETNESIYGQGGLTPEKVGASASNALAMGMPGLGAAVPKLAGTIGGAVAEGGALGAAQSPEDRLKGFLTGGAIQGGLTAGGKLLNKVGDVGMQIATGRKKYTPGVGTELANEGLFGTQGMMRGQTEKGLKRVGGEMQDIASQIPGIDARKIGQEMGGELTSPLTGGGQIAPSARDAGTVGQLQDFATDVASRGTETGAEALARRRAAGASAFSAKTQDPKLSPIAQASKLEQQKYSQALKEADPRMVPVDTRYAALKKAENGLKSDPSLPSSLLGLASMTSKSIPGGSFATSAASQAASKGGRLAEFLAPLARQAAVGGARPSAEELAAYEQYLKETGQK